MFTIQPILTTTNSNYSINGETIIDLHETLDGCNYAHGIITATDMEGIERELKCKNSLRLKLRGLTVHVGHYSCYKKNVTVFWTSLTYT